MNEALLGKLYWRSMTSQSLFSSYVCRRFVLPSGRPNLRYVSSSIWTSIKLIYSRIFEDVIWLLGKESRLSFWYGRWLHPPLVDRLCLTSANLEGSVSDYSLNGEWRIPWYFRVAFPRVTLDIEQVKFLGEGSSDCCVWKHSVDGSVSSKLLYDHWRAKGASLSWLKLLWAKFIPPSHSLACWKAIS